MSWSSFLEICHSPYHCIIVFRGEHILLFLVQTVARQITEQRSYCPKGLDVPNSKRRAQAALAAANYPEHDLEPPKFARQALELIIKDWRAVKNMILSGTQSSIR